LSGTWARSPRAATPTPGSFSATCSLHLPVFQGCSGPTFIEVEANGRRFKEMHIDGGATTEVLILPDTLLATGRGIAERKPQARVWVVINNHVTPQFEVVEAGLMPTVSRSFSTLIKGGSRQTLFATAEFIGHDRFNLTFIDNGFDEQLKAHYGSSVIPAVQKIDSCCSGAIPC